MKAPPILGLKILMQLGLLFKGQHVHGLVKKFADYVTLLNTLVLLAVYSL